MMTSSKAGGSMSTATQRVVVIQDASKEISSCAIKWAIDGLSLKPGDELTLLGVLHQVTTPMGYKSRVDSNSVLAANSNIITDEVARREQEYNNSAEISSLSKLYESKQIGFNINVVAASSPKFAALEAANRLKATWIILDRQMKKDKNYFMERLSCGISRMKRNNSVELLREPKVNRRNDEFSEGNVNTIRYDEMLPGEETKLLELIDDEDLLGWELCGMSLSNYEPKHSCIQLEDEDYITIQISAEDESSLVSKMQLIQNDEVIIQETKKSSNIVEETLPYGSSNQELEGEPEYPVCKQCGNERPKTLSIRDFTYDELYTATNGFSDKNYLSQGGFGFVYKGKLTNGQWIAVKQYKHASSQGEMEFRSEVHVLGMLRHKNVIMLLGSCSEGNHRLLVYEYVCNGSLDQHLSKRSPSTLSWEHRLKIALGAATGLNYLHQNNIIHRDMRPNNILLTHEYEPMLGDFGLSRKQQDESGHSSENKVVGTFGYLAPEYTERGRVSNKTDVYSFGVVLLEVITGRTTMDKNLEDKGLVGWARPLLRERKYPELIDERILDCHDLHQLFWIITLADQCLRKDPDRRPSMAKVECTLKRMIDGETVDGIDDFSPPHSSISSLPRSQDEQESQQQEITSEDISSISRSQTSEALSMSSMLHSSTLQSTSVSSESVFSNKSKSFWNNIRGKPQSTKLLYDEMLT